MAEKYTYERIDESKLPKEGLRFDTPGQNQGQIVECSYAAWPPDKWEACRGDMYMRVFDKSDRTTEYYIRKDAR